MMLHSLSSCGRHTRSGTAPCRLSQNIGGPDISSTSTACASSKSDLASSNTHHNVLFMTRGSTPRMYLHLCLVSGQAGSHMITSKCKCFPGWRIAPLRESHSKSTLLRCRPCGRALHIGCLVFTVHIGYCTLPHVHTSSWPGVLLETFPDSSPSENPSR